MPDWLLLIRLFHSSIQMVVRLFTTFAALLFDSIVHTSIKSLNMPLNATFPDLDLNALDIEKSPLNANAPYQQMQDLRFECRVNTARLLCGTKLGFAISHTRVVR